MPNEEQQRAAIALVKRQLDLARATKNRLQTALLENTLNHLLERYGTHTTRNREDTK